MKRVFLYIALLFVTGSSVRAGAQTFSIPHDTVTATLSGDAKYYNKITNISAAPIQIVWNIPNHDLPVTWQNVSICDNYNCYGSSSGLLIADSVFTTASIAPGAEADFYVWPDLSSAVPGTHYFQIKMKDGTYIKNSWYIFTKSTTGVVSLNQSYKDVVLYPNPTSGEVTVLHDAALNIRDIVVYSTDGRIASSVKASGDASKIDVSKMPSGIYIVQLLNESGHIAATSRFTRN